MGEAHTSAEPTATALRCFASAALGSRAKAEQNFNGKGSVLHACPGKAQSPWTGVTPSRVFWHAVMSWYHVVVEMLVGRDLWLSSCLPPAPSGAIANTRPCRCVRPLPAFACVDRAGKVSPTRAMEPWRTSAQHQGALTKGATGIHHLPTMSKVQVYLRAAPLKLWIHAVEILIIPKNNTLEPVTQRPAQKI